MSLPTLLIIAAAIIVISGLIFFRKIFSSSSSTKENHPVVYNKDDAEFFIKRLDELGYYKYADPKDLSLLKRTMIEAYDPDNELVSVWEDNSPTPKDLRYYFCDAETLFEEGGFTEMLKDLQPTFKKIGLEMRITGHHEEWDDANHWLNHTITINGTKYTIFKNFTEMGWDEAVQRFVEILNKELEKQNKEDRVYPAGGGNDGRIIFLSNEQFSYIDSVYKNPSWKPLRLKDWCRVMEVKYMKVD